MYFSEEGRLARISVSDGSITEFPLMSLNSSPYSIAADPAGGIWFSEYPGNRIGHLTAAGNFVECESPKGSGGGLAVTADGTVWFATAHGVAKIKSCGTP